ncbi:MAG: tyrosine-type recombinase/integrase [Pseudomonadota bacterium]
MALTDLHIKKMVPRKKRYEVFDGKKGLCIRVMPSGAKTWIFRYHFDEMRRRMSLGSYPGISLAKARELHAQAIQDLQRSIDPGEKQRSAKAKRKTAPTFKDLLDEFWDLELGKTPTGKERRRLVEKDALAPWGNRKVIDITRRDAVLVLDMVRKRAPVTANRLQGVLVRMFNFASERGIIEHSPLTGMRRPKEATRSRVLTDSEIKLLWFALDLDNKDVDIYRVSKLALKMILLTGQRPGEVCGMTCAEIDVENDFWNIPASRMKNSDSQRVPLCPMALEIIEQARIYSGDCDYVFQSSYKPGESLGRQAITRAIARHWAEFGIEKAFTPHDLRRTLRTKLAELGVSDIVAERVLGHKLQGMMAVYNRHAYDVEKRHALNVWEQRLKEILGLDQPTSGKVITFGVRRT